MPDSPLPSPRRPYFGNAPGIGSGPSSPRPHRKSFGFSPPANQAVLPNVAENTRYLPSINTAVRHALLSPQLSTPVDQLSGPPQGQGQFQYVFPDQSPRPSISSPRHTGGELPPRSRRNSAAIVSISLSSRSRSRTPRGSHANLQTSGNATPSKGSNLTPRGEEAVLVQMGESWRRSSAGGPGMEEELDDWQPAGGMLLGDMDEDSAIADDFDGYDGGRVWSGISDSPAKAVMRPGMLFGEGLEFQGETIEPAVGKGADGDGILPLRRDGSGVGQKRRPGLQEEGKKRYEVVRQLGSGSYAVVYLVREKNGRKREYALKCLSKQDLSEDQIETQLFEATIHLSLPIHQNIVTLHQTLHTKKWLFLMLELCPGEDLFYWLEKARDASPPPVNARLPEETHNRTFQHPSSSSKFSSSSIPFSSSQLFGGMNHMSMAMSGSHSSSPFFAGQSPASLLFTHHNGNSSNAFQAAATPPTPSLLSAFSANTLLSSRRLRLIASMFSQMCEAVEICHEAGVSHRDIKPENFICCDSVELETVAEGQEDEGGFGPQAKRKVVVKLTDFGLATTEEDSGDVECGSKPYMSYECRNNLGPTYMPAPADVWSLGIVLINMLFHRNPWKDPTEGDPNFDNFLGDPTGFFLSKFTGIGRDVATYLAEHVLCVDVENRVTAGQFGKWAKSLPDMIGGKKAMLHIKTERRERREREKEHKLTDNGRNVSQVSGSEELFVKSPITQIMGQERKASASALTSTAPIASTALIPGSAVSVISGQTSSSVSSNTPTISATIESPENIEQQEEEESIPTPELDHDELTSATTYDEQPTPLDSNTMYSPDQSERGEETSTLNNESDARSLSTNKRRKRGVRKGKAAQAALAKAAAGDDPSTQEERDALLAELAAASQSLARDLSKGPKKEDLDFNRIEDFPPLGTSPAQIAQEKKSKWRALMKTSAASTNPELAALARRVAERDAGSGGNWSAPAKLQGHPDSKRSPFRSTATASSGISSAFSSFGQVSSATSSMSGVEDDDWRRRPGKLETHKEEDGEEARGRREKRREARRDESLDRARKAAAAAAAITGNMGSMGSFGTGPALPGPLYRPAHHQAPAPSVTIKTLQQPAPKVSGQPSALSASKPLQTTVGSPHRAAGFVESRSSDRPSLISVSTAPDSISLATLPPPSKPAHPPAIISAQQYNGSRQSVSSFDSGHTVVPKITGKGEVGADGPNKPKIKGQIQSLAKMLSGLKTKGKD